MTAEALIDAAQSQIYKGLSYLLLVLPLRKGKSGPWRNRRLFGRSGPMGREVSETGDGRALVEFKAQDVIDYLLTNSVNSSNHKEPK